MSSYVFDPVQVFLFKFPAIPCVLCEAGEAKDVFSSNLVKLSRQESVHFVEHSGGWPSGVVWSRGQR